MIEHVRDMRFTVVTFAGSVALASGWRLVENRVLSFTISWHSKPLKTRNAEIYGTLSVGRVPRPSARENRGRFNSILLAVSIFL